MSAGAVFKLIANDGKADRMIMATALLNQRIKDVMCARAAAGKEDPAPTLVDLEKTHILFVNAHFKPYAAIGFEYNKVTPGAGTPQLGGRITFSIPQFGDFFHDMVLRVRLGACSAVAGPVPIAGGPYVPTQLNAGTNGRPSGTGTSAGTGATIYAVAANLATQGTTPTVSFANPVTNTVLTGSSGIFTTAITGVLAKFAADTSATGAMTYDLATYALIQTQATAYWTSAMISANVQASNASVAAASARPFINYMFEIALSNANPSFSLTMTQLTYNNIASATVLGLYFGFMAAVALNNTSSQTQGNNYLGYIYATINQSSGSPWIVPGIASYGLVDAFGQYISTPIASSSPANYRNFVRYCEFPGNRLISNVRFDVNGNPLDSYSQNVTVMLEKFTVPADKRNGYNRLTGQTAPLFGLGGLRQNLIRDANSANTPRGIGRWATGQSNSTVALFTTNPADVTTAYLGGSLIDPTIPANVTLNQYVSQYDISQRQTTVLNGPQTPKPVQPPLELWHKLKFWFCDDVRQSIPSVSIPFGQRFISVDLAPATNLVYEFQSLYVETAIVAPQLTISDNQTVMVAQRTVSYLPVNQYFGVTPPAIEAAELYINNIFVNPEIHDIYIKRVGFSLIRVYREQITPVNTSGQSRELLSQIKWPIEYMYVGVQPKWNTTNPVATSSGTITGNENTWRDWHRMTRQVDADDGEFCIAQTPIATTAVSFSDTASTANDVVSNSITTIGFQTLNSHLITATSISDASDPSELVGSRIGQVIPDRYWLPVPTVDAMTLIAHGISIFDTYQDTFFNQYMPYHYGNGQIVTPEDPGAFFVNMALYPRAYQPSGHLNVSRARETYLGWNTSYVGVSTNSLMIVVAVAINFLLVSDGSAVLRYST
jgi:hypothetical protein